MNEELKENVLDCLNMLEIVKDDLSDYAKIIAEKIKSLDRKPREDLTAEAVAIYNLVNATAKSLAVFQAHTRHFKRREIVIEVIQ